MYPLRAFLSVRQLANVTRTGLKIEIETVGTTSKFRGSQSAEKRSNFSCQVAATIFLIRTKTLFRKLSIYLRTSASSFHSPFFFLPFAQLFFLFFFWLTNSPSLSPPLSLKPQSHRTQSDGGCFLRNIVASCPRFLHISVQGKTLRMSSVACQLWFEKIKNRNSQIRVAQRNVR